MEDTMATKENGWIDQNGYAVFYEDGNPQRLSMIETEGNQSALFARIERELVRFIGYGKRAIENVTLIAYVFAGTNSAQACTDSEQTEFSRVDAKSEHRDEKRTSRENAG